MEQEIAQVTQSCSRDLWVVLFERRANQPGNEKRALTYTWQYRAGGFVEGELAVTAAAHDNRCDAALGGAAGELTSWQSTKQRSSTPAFKPD